MLYRNVVLEEVSESLPKLASSGFPSVNAGKQPAAAQHLSHADTLCAVTVLVTCPFRASTEQQASSIR